MTVTNTTTTETQITPARGLARYNRPRLGELVTLNRDVDLEAFRIADALAAWVGDIYVERHLQVDNVPNWYHRSWFSGILVNGHIVTRGSTSPVKRTFYVEVDGEWVELTDPSQIL